MPHNVAPPHTVSTFVRARHVAWVFVCVLFVSGVCVCVSESRSGQVAGRAQLKEPVYLNSLSLSLCLSRSTPLVSIYRQEELIHRRENQTLLSLSLSLLCSLSLSLARFNTTSTLLSVQFRSRAKQDTRAEQSNTTERRYKSLCCFQQKYINSNSLTCQNQGHNRRQSFFVRKKKQKQSETVFEKFGTLRKVWERTRSFYNNLLIPIQQQQLHNQVPVDATAITLIAPRTTKLL